MMGEFVECCVFEEEDWFDFVVECDVYWGVFLGFLQYEVEGGFELQYGVGFVIGEQLEVEDVLILGDGFVEVLDWQLDVVECCDDGCYELNFFLRLVLFY